jgi:hypothetical protein
MNLIKMERHWQHLSEAIDLSEVGEAEDDDLDLAVGMAIEHLRDKLWDSANDVEIDADWTGQQVTYCYVPVPKPQLLVTLMVEYLASVDDDGS